MENKLEECWISAYSRWLLEDRTIITIQMLQERGISAYLKKFLHPVRDLYIFFNKYRRKLGHKFAYMPLWWNRNTRAFNSGCNVANTKMPENLSTCLSTYQIPKTYNLFFTSNQSLISRVGLVYIKSSLRRADFFFNPLREELRQAKEWFSTAELPESCGPSSDSWHLIMQTYIPSKVIIITTLFQEDSIFGMYVCLTYGPQLEG